MELKLNAVIRGGDRVLAEYLNESGLEIAKEQKSQGDIVTSYEDREAYIREILECSSWEQIIEIIKREFAFNNIKDVLRIAIAQEECKASGFPIRWVRILYTV